MLARSAPMKRSPMKRTRQKSKTAAERRHMDRVAQMDCLVCGISPVEVHHVVSDGFQRLTRRHDRVIPLCSDHHRTGPDAVHQIGASEFNSRFFDQLAMAQGLWEGGI